MKTLSSCVLLLALATLLPGCLVLPTGRGTVLNGSFISNEELTFLDDPATRDSQVVERLGQPHLEWQDERIYAYHWDLREGVAVWAVPMAGGYGAAVGSTELSSRHVLLIQFDEQGRVLRHQSMTRPLPDNYGKMIREWAAQPLPAKAGD